MRSYKSTSEYSPIYCTYVQQFGTLRFPVGFEGQESAERPWRDWKSGKNEPLFPCEWSPAVHISEYTHHASQSFSQGKRERRARGSEDCPDACKASRWELEDTERDVTAPWGWTAGSWASCSRLDFPWNVQRHNKLYISDRKRIHH